MALARMASKKSDGGVESSTRPTQRSQDRRKAGTLDSVERLKAKAPEVPVGRVGVTPDPSDIKPKRGRPLQRDKDRTLTAIKPWVADGMDRSTWYRRRQKETKK